MCKYVFRNLTISFEFLTGYGLFLGEGNVSLDDWKLGYVWAGERDQEFSKII